MFQNASAPSERIGAQTGLSPQIPLWHWCPILAAPHRGVVKQVFPAGSRSEPIASGVLAILEQQHLREEIDRIAAAVGVRVVHAGGRGSVSRKSWSAAAAVVLDQEAAQRCGQAALPRRAHVSVLSNCDADAAAWAAAVAVGAERVLKLPQQEHELVGELAEAAESARDDSRHGEGVAVIGGCGGAGASLLAAALAQTAGDALLLDLDPWGGGIDLLVGGESTPGLRWPDLAIAGGRLSWPAIREALPRQHGVSVLSGTRHCYELEPAPVAAIVEAGRRGGVTVVCDLPRRLTEAAQAALDSVDLVVLVSRCDVRACAATTALVPALRAINPNLGLVVRGPAPGGLRAAEIADIAGAPLLASMRAEPGLSDQLERRGLRLGRRSALAAAARSVLTVLPSRRRASIGSAA